MSKTAAAWYSIRRHSAVAAAVLATAVAAGQPVPKSSAEILIYGDIGESWWSESVSAGDFVRELAALDVEAVTVRIASIGGSVPDGIAIYNAMKRHPANITTVVDSMALSIASLIACAGDTRQMAENATLMVHAPWTIAAGNAVELRECADMLDTWAGAMSTSYSAATGETPAQALARLTDGKDHWYTAEEAKAAGFIDEIVSAAPVAAMAGFDLSKFRDVPAHIVVALNDAKHQQLNAAAKRKKKMKMAGDDGMRKADEQFLADMIEHHQMALDMAESLIGTSPDTPLREFAEGIIEAQAGEIELMRVWQDASPAGGSSQASAPSSPRAIQRIAANTAPPTESNPMDPKEVAAAEAAKVAAAEAARKLEVDAARAEGVKAEVQRRTDVAAAFKPFAKHEGMAELEAAAIADHNVTAAVANQRILAQMAKGATPVAGKHGVEITEDERDKLINASVHALMARAGVFGKDGKRVIADGTNPCRGMTLLDMARASLARAGYRTEGLDKMQLVAAAFTQSTSDFPILLENTMHKTLQSAYALAPDTWSRFCATGTVSDFRPHKRYRVGSLSNLDAVTELSEFKNKTIPDGEKASITASTKGNIINLSRQAIINDDLGAFVGLAASMGRAAKRTVESDVYATLALNSGLGPALEDGDTLFHANHKNITTGAAITMLAIDADRVAMKSQLDVGGNDFLDLMPSVLLLPVSLGGTARSINDGQYDPDTANKLQKPNIVKGIFSGIIDTPRLTGTRRYIFADPSVAPVIEVAFLDGNMEPFLESEMGFDVDGSRWKVRLDYGIAGVDYRGAVTNAGA